MNLPEALYSAAQVRELDRLAIEEYRIPGAKLMQRAGAALFELLSSCWPRARRVAVVCGTGNNGGDGYVLARLARAAGLGVDVLSLGAANKMQGDAAAARKQCKSAGVTIRNFQAELLAGHDVIVDALLGTGLERDVEGEWRTAIEAINASRLPVLAADVPSGLNADTGHAMGAAVRASATMSFIGLKAGLFTGAGREHAGQIYFDDLKVPPQVHARITTLMQRLTETSLQGLMPKRRRDMHKGDAGHLLVIGGDRGMPGAARLAGEAAYRAGAGLVMLATHPEHAASIAAARPELIVHGVASPQDLRPLLARADVIAVGPGLGQGGWGNALFSAALDTNLPMVVDADALKILAGDPLMHEDWILTPHPGEAARMLGMTTQAIQADRITAAREIAASFGGVCVLKGAGTLVASFNMERRASGASRASLAMERRASEASGAPLALERRTGGSGKAALEDGVVSVCDRGNPGMASAGMGDVLTGVIAGLRAQGLISPIAARLGVWLHAAAGDDAAASGEIGMLASDLFPHLRTRLNHLVGHAGG